MWPSGSGKGLQNPVPRFNSGHRLHPFAYDRVLRARSSAGERFPDTEEVTGSNPVAPTSTSGSLDSPTVVACQRFAREPLKVVGLSLYASARLRRFKANERVSPCIRIFRLLPCAPYGKTDDARGDSRHPIDAGDVLLGSRMDRAGGGCLTSY